VLTASASVIGAILITNPVTDTLHSVSGLQIFAVNLTLPCQSDPAFTGKFKVVASSATSTATKCSLSVGDLFENVLVVSSLATQFLKRGQPLPVPVQVFLGPFLALEAWFKIASQRSMSGLSVYI
jgi:hypothetical protein